MDVAVELEDDLFFEDLSKQISLLIMDEDEENHLAYCPPEPLQVSFFFLFSPLFTLIENFLVQSSISVQIP